MSEPRATAGRPMLWSSLESLSLAVVSFVMLAMLARYLGADAFGQAAIALGVVQIAASFVESFFHDAVVQRQGLRQDEIDAAHTRGVLMALALVSAIALWGLMPASQRPAGAAVGVPELALWMSPSVLAAAWSAMAIAQLRRQLSMRRLALAMAGSRLLAGGVAIASLWQGAGVWAMVINQNLAALALLLLLAAVRAPQARLTRDVGAARELTGYAGWNSVSGLLNANMSRFFQVACGLVLPAAVVGQLALALRVVEMLVSVLVTGVSRVSLSQLAAAANQGRDLAASFILTTRRLCFVMVPVLVLLAVLAEPLVRFIGRSGWGQAAVLVSVFALAQALRAPTFLANTLFLAQGRPRLSLLVSVSELAGLVLLTLLLQSPLAWPARLLVVLPLVLLLMQRRSGIALLPLFAAVRQPFVAAAAMGVVLYAGLSMVPAAWTAQPLPLLLGAGAAGALIYAALAAGLLGSPRVAAVWRNLSSHSARPS